jgi:hypothetical protein
MIAVLVAHLEDFGTENKLNRMTMNVDRACLAVLETGGQLTHCVMPHAQKVNMGSMVHAMGCALAGDSA